MPVQKKRGAMKTDGRLSGSRAPLHDGCRFEWPRDDPVLIALNRCGDLTHLTRSVALEFLEQHVT
jgi:hypothetical protein